MKNQWEQGAVFLGRVLIAILFLHVAGARSWLRPCSREHER
jgi:hypothetical protein